MSSVAFNPFWILRPTISLCRVLNLFGHKVPMASVVLKLESIHEDAREIYQDTGKRATAVENANLIIASGHRVQPSLRDCRIISTKYTGKAIKNPKNAFVASNFGSRSSHIVTMRIKDSDKKFLEDLEGSWMEYEDEFQQFARNYSLSNDQKKQFQNSLLNKMPKASTGNLSSHTHMNSFWKIFRDLF